MPKFVSHLTKDLLSYNDCSIKGYTPHTVWGV